MFEVVVRRVKGAEWVVISTPDLATAVAKRAALVAGYHERGFVGGRNAFQCPRSGKGGCSHVSPPQPGQPAGCFSALGRARGAAA